MAVMGVDAVDAEAHPAGAAAQAGTVQAAGAEAVAVQTAAGQVVAAETVAGARASAAVADGRSVIVPANWVAANRTRSVSGQQETASSTAAIQSRN
jgi:hypothetical protein